MRLRFYGAAGEVTGSCTLLETDRARVLVDFGLHQGNATAERRNRRLPPIRPRELDAVVLTHAHLDHSGRLPLLARHEFAAPIWATPATIDLCGILLRDAAHVQQSDAERANRRRAHRGGRFTSPLYSIPDVEAILPRLAGLDYQHEREIAPGVVLRFSDAGHILGSASVCLTVTEDGSNRTLVFSGDIGPRGAPLLRDPRPFDRADLIVLESTYGDRDHRSADDTIRELVSVLGEARTPRGRVLIPAFAVGRTQQLIYHLGRLRRDGVIVEPTVFLDSPMAISTTELYRRHRDLFDDDAWAIIQAGDTCLDFPGLKMTRTPQESMAINSQGGGVVVISASGMCTGGRILHHLRHGLGNDQTHVVFVGYQAEGTLGRRIVEGEQTVRVMGESIRVRATVHTLGGLSAHAGQRELIGWLGAMRSSSPRVLLNHGEDPARRVLAERIQQELGLRAELPAYQSLVTV
ncbi:MAG: MBL fold metallo-hydrolase [Phycisphaeraceae bacterium]|nr:MBL fold metallo-hydrolase [Phycisphaeraceae bacterium]